MAEQATTTEGTAFGRVLGRIMEARGIPAEPAEVRALGERAGFDGEQFRALATTDPGVDLGGPLNGLADELGLAAEEKSRLAWAYVYGRAQETGDGGGH